MERLLLKTLGGPLALLLMLGGLVSVRAQTGGIQGVVIGEDKKGVQGYPVEILRIDTKAVYKTKTGKKGDFVYMGLPLGPYYVSIFDPNGSKLGEQQIRVSFNDLTQVKFDLAEEKAKAEAARQKQIEEDPELKRRLEEAQKTEKDFASLSSARDAALALMAEKKYAEAAATLESVVPSAKGNNLIVLYGMIGDASYRAKDYQKALDYFHKAISAAPGDGSLHNQLGNVYVAMGKMNEAQTEFQRAAEVDPAKAATYYFNSGVVMYNAGKMDEAAAAFKKATETDPNYAEAHFQLGNALMGKIGMSPDGKLEPAPGTIEALETYLKLVPNGPNSENAKAMLATLQGQVETSYKAPKKRK